VLIKSTGKSIQVNTSSPDKSVACTVEAFSFEFPPGEFPVYETQKLKSLLNVANGSEDIAVDVVMAMDSPVNLVFSDGYLDVTYALADKIAIPPSPVINKLPPFEATISLDQQFISTFVRAKSALTETELVSIACKDNTAQFRVGHQGRNGNSITLTAKCDTADDIPSREYSAKYLRDILVANKEVKDCQLMVSSKGLLKTVFVADNIVSTYYLTRSLSSS
jgi:hypothetical protein